MLKNKLLGWRKAEKKNPGVYIEHEIFKSFITQAGVHMALYYAFLQFYPFSSFQFFPLHLHVLIFLHQPSNRPPPTAIVFT